MQYVSLDIETTGLDPKKNQIVEVGAVLDTLGDTSILVGNLPMFRAVIMHEEMLMGAYCSNLHRDLWLEINNVQSNYGDQIKEKGYIELVKPSIFRNSLTNYYCTPEKLEDLLYTWLSIHIGNNVVDVANDVPIKINVAGKNPGTFDIPFLKALPGWEGLIDFQRRIIDPAILCVCPDDEHLPNLQECLKRCAIAKTVTHTAVDDGLDIVKIIRTCAIDMWPKKEN